MRTLVVCLSILACHKESVTESAATTTPTTPTTTPTTLPTTAVPAPTATATGHVMQPGTEAGARALLMEIQDARNPERVTLSKLLRPDTADYAELFDAPTAAKLGPQYEEQWDKTPIVIGARSDQTELKLFAATTEDLVAGTGNAREFPGGWKRVAPHLKPHRTWYCFKFVKPGEDLGTSFDGLTFVKSHWVITPKPWRGL